MLDISEIIKNAGIPEKSAVLLGRYKAKINPEVYEEFKTRLDGKYVILSGMTPFKYGEGRTTVGIGLADALRSLGRTVAYSMPQPTINTLIKYFYSGLGSEKSCIVPRNEILPFFTSDSYRVVMANNLLCAILDDYIAKGNHIGISELSIRRISELRDKALTRIVTGLGNNGKSSPVETGFWHLESSELMNMLLLSLSAQDLKERIAKAAVAYTEKESLIKISGLKLAEAVNSFLSEAFYPNLVQTNDETPVFVHGITSGILGLGSPSVISDRIALKLFDFVVSESGFGTDLGYEKFVNIKCRRGGFRPHCVVLVITLASVKAASGSLYGLSEKEVFDVMKKQNLSAVSDGFPNLEKHIENVVSSGVPVIVAVNRMASDTGSEIEIVRKKCLSAGAFGCEAVEVYKDGSSAAKTLAREVAKACERKGEFKMAYPEELPVEEKIRVIASRYYGATDVDFSPEAAARLKFIADNGFNKFLVLMVKTPFSLTDNNEIKGRPRNFRITIREIRIQTGSELVLALM